MKTIKELMKLDIERIAKELKAARTFARDPKIRKQLAAVQRAIKAYGDVNPHVIYYAHVVHVTIEVNVESLKDRKLLKLIERLDNVVEFYRSTDTAAGREFESAFTMGAIRLQLRCNVEGGEESEKCRRVIKAVKQGQPVIEYGYECA